MKFMEYETANPGQDENLATEIEQKRQALLEAGIDPQGAHRVATDLAARDRTASIPNLRGRADSDKESPDSRGTDRTYVPPPSGAHHMHNYNGGGGNYNKPHHPHVSNPDEVYSPVQRFSPVARGEDEMLERHDNRFAKTPSRGV
jgi:hypothetical protein